MIGSRVTAAAAPEAGTIERRRFLRRVSAFAVSVSAALVTIPVLRAFLSPTARTVSREDWIKVADDTALLESGVPIRVDFVTTKYDAWVEARAMNSVWLYTEDGESFKAYNGHCTHLGCGFAYSAERKTFVCPCHRGEFDVKTGAVLDGPPPRPLDELKAEVRDAAVYVSYQDFRLGIAEKVQV